MIIKEEVIEKKREKVAELVKQYLDDCTMRLSIHTVRSQKTGLTAFAQFLDKTPIINATKMDVRRFLNHLKENKRAQMTIALRFFTIKSFYRYLKTYHQISIPSLDDVDINDYPKATWEGQGQDPLTRTEIRALMEAPDNLRDTLIIATLYYLGLRANELALLKLADVDTEKRIVSIIGKGNKFRLVPFSPKLDRAIQLWLRQERRSYVSSDGPYFFPSMHGNHLHTKAIHEIVHNAAVKAGIQETIGWRADGKRIYKVHTHILRHSYARHAIDDDIPLNHIQRMMGHSSISTTIRYAGESSVFKAYYDKFKGV